MGGLDHTCRSCQERVLPVVIGSLMQGKAFHVSIFPFVLGICLHVVGRLRVVVIHNQLMLLPVAFTGSEHVGACFLQHRNEIRNHDGLREQVLGGTEQGRALPFPGVLGDIIIITMTGPEGNMSVL